MQLRAQELVKVEVAVLGSPSLNSPVDIKSNIEMNARRAQGLCERRGARPGLPVPNSPLIWSLWR